MDSQSPLLTASYIFLILIHTYLLVSDKDLDFLKHPQGLNDA